MEFVVSILRGTNSSLKKVCCHCSLLVRCLFHSLWMLLEEPDFSNGVFLEIVWLWISCSCGKARWICALKMQLTILLEITPMLLRSRCLWKANTSFFCLFPSPPSGWWEAVRRLVMGCAVTSIALCNLSLPRVKQGPEGQYSEFPVQHHGLCKTKRRLGCTDIVAQE